MFLEPAFYSISIGLLGIKIKRICLPDAEMPRTGDRDAGIKKAKIPVCLVLSRDLSLESEISLVYKMPKYVQFLLEKSQWKIPLSVLLYRLPWYRGKRKKHNLAS